MRILQINSFFTTGGPPGIVNGIYDTLKERGYECKIAAARAPMYVPEDSIKIGSDFGVRINALKARLCDDEGLSAKRATKKLVEKIREYNPDIIHLHNLHGYYINIEILFDYLKNEFRGKVIWTLHDCWAFTGHCAHFTYAKCYQWKDACQSCSKEQKKSYPKCILKGRAKRNFEKKKAAFSNVPDMTIVTPSEWLAGLVKQSFLKDYPVKVINNGIDLNVFKPTLSNFREKYNLSDKYIILGVAFGWGGRKGLDVFVELSKLLDERYRIVIVGTNKELDRTLPENIISIHKTVNRTELAEIYTAADLFVNPTREEVLGMVNLEALGCRTPVVTFDSGGSPECIDDSCGYSVPCDDINALKEKITEICENQTFSERSCGIRAAGFDKKDKYGEYMSVYGNDTWGGGID